MDPRFVQWCSGCGYGADPQPPQQSKRELRRAAREQQRSMKLFESLRTAKNLRPTSAVGVAVTVLAAIVHLSTLALLAAPVLLVLAMHEAFTSFIVLFLAWMTWFAVRPHFIRGHVNAGKSINRKNAPAFYALLDRCAAEIGSAAPEAVLFNVRFNAATARVGWKRTRILVLGAPLWSVLSGPERIALLGHELAHQVNGDTTHGTWAAGARRTIREWTALLDPNQTRGERFMTARVRGTRAGGMAMIAQLLMAIAFAPFFLIALACQWLLTRLDLYCGQRAEYLADELGARLAGSEAAHGCLAVLALGDAVLGFMQAARNRHKGRRNTAAAGGSGAGAGADGLWQSVAEYVQSVPETERQRRQVVDRLRHTRTDISHPANHLRLALVAERPQLPPSLVVSETEWAAVDAELAPAYLATARSFLG